MSHNTESAPSLNLSETADPQTTAPAWWSNAVVYQIYPRSFADSNGDGIGDLKGIENHLDHLAELGVDVIWLSPVYPSPQADNGYDISDYQDIDPTMGTLAEFDSLLAGIHQRGMKLMMDLVVNHTSDEHPWFVEARSSRDNPKRDWYWWRPGREVHDPSTQVPEPTNWESFFSGPSWTFDEATGEYYLHLFATKQPDLNWENPQVREAVYEMMRWWLDRGVDGFRMDVINLISKRVGPNGELADGPLRPGRTVGNSWPSVVNGPRIHEFLHEMNREVFANRPGQFITVGETPGVTVEDGRLYSDRARAELDMVFQFEHMSLDRGATRFDIKPLDLRDLKETLNRWQVGLADAGWNSLYWSNHDQPRTVSRFGDDGEYRVASAKALATLLHLHRGTPYIYQGEEIGMTNVPFGGIEDFADIESLQFYAVEVAAERHPEEILPGLREGSRDNARTPVQWSAAQHAGFTTGMPWLPVNPNYVDINVEAAGADPNSVFAHYQDLIALRHNDPVVALGEFAMLLPDDQQVYAFTRSLAGVTLLVLVNVSGAPATVDLSADLGADEAKAWAAADVYFGEPDADGSLNLGPWEARIYRRQG